MTANKWSFLAGALVACLAANTAIVAQQKFARRQPGRPARPARPGDIRQARIISPILPVIGDDGDAGDDGTAPLSAAEDGGSARIDYLGLDADGTIRVVSRDDGLPVVAPMASLSCRGPGAGPLTWYVEVRPEEPDGDDACPVVWARSYDLDAFTPSGGMTTQDIPFSDDIPVAEIPLPPGSVVWIKVAVRDASGDLAAASAPANLP